MTTTTAAPMQQTSEAKKKFDAARAAITDGEARSLSARVMNGRWAAFFAAEDALKAVSSWK